MAENKKEKFKYENIHLNNKADVEKTYVAMLNLIYNLQTNLQQLIAAHKAVINNKEQ